MRNRSGYNILQHHATRNRSVEQWRNNGSKRLLLCYPEFTTRHLASDVRWIVRDERTGQKVEKKDKEINARKPSALQPLLRVN